MPDLFHPIKLAIDGNEANVGRRVGSNAYAYEILRALEELTRTKRKNFHLTILLGNEPVGDMPAERPGFEYKVLRPAKMWTQWTVSKHLFINRGDYDCYYTPGHYAPRYCPVPYISSVMDLAFLVYPEQFRKSDLWQLVSWTKYSVKRAAKVAVISKFTKAEVMKYYDKRSEEIILAYPGFAGEITKLPAGVTKDLLRKMGIENPFFLYLGTLQPRKNIVRLIEAFEEFAMSLGAVEGAPPIQLVLAGKNGWLTGEIEEKIASSAAREQIVMTGFIDENQKAALLSKALGTFNLGFYEGFGIPPLESLAYGTIPVVAKNTSMPEVVGKAGIKVDPFSTTEVREAMFKLSALNARQRGAVLKSAAGQLEKFSYLKSANSILTEVMRLERRG